MANCCQKVRGNKTNQRRKQQQNKILKQNNRKTGRGILSYRFYFTDILERYIWIFYFTYFNLHDSPKSQLTLEFSGLRCSPLPLLFVSMVSFNCTLLPALFTPVVAPVPNHSHHVCARAVWSLHSLVVWASLCLGSPPLHGGTAPSVGKFFPLYFF